MEVVLTFVAGVFFTSWVNSLGTTSGNLDLICCLTYCLLICSMRRDAAQFQLTQYIVDIGRAFNEGFAMASMEAKIDQMTPIATFSPDQQVEH